MWNSQAKTYDKYLRPLRWSQSKLVSLLELAKNATLLDLACGTGWAVRYAADSANGRGEFYGIDIASEVIDKAETDSVNYENVHFRKANAEKLPFDSDFFDYIICSNAFHHFSDPDKVAKEAYRVLKPRGRICILDTTADSFIIRLLDRLERKLERGHVKIYSTEEYWALFRGAGLLYITRKSIMLPMKIHIGEK
ncbi:MAG TPA: methyltransferase domain-containing protein, partial [Dehalococcoidia bacterium]|nr:methyltransferase domain-containing protein [Dehalococcoidia bacterium]